METIYTDIKTLQRPTTLRQEGKVSYVVQKKRMIT